MCLSTVLVRDVKHINEEKARRPRNKSTSRSHRSSAPGPMPAPFTSLPGFQRSGLPPRRSRARRSKIPRPALRLHGRRANLKRPNPRSCRPSFLMGSLANAYGGKMRGPGPRSPMGSMANGYGGTMNAQRRGGGSAGSGPPFGSMAGGSMDGGLPDRVVVDGELFGDDYDGSPQYVPNILGFGSFGPGIGSGAAAGDGGFGGRASGGTGGMGGGGGPGAIGGRRSGRRGGYERSTWRGRHARRDG